MEHHDAVIVGARCAGSALAIELARRDWDVLMVDRDRFPSTTLSTHGLWPNGLARLEALGVLDRLRAKHRPPLYESRIRGLGHEIVGPFTPVGGYDRAAAPRRVVLDEAGVETALAAGADGRFGTRVVELLGSGSEDDPVRGVVLDDGDRISARWVFGADGRGSTVARRLGLEKRLPLRGEIAIAYAYWKGIRDDGYGHMQIEYDGILNRVPVEDGLTMVIANGPPELTHGTTSGLSPGGAFRVAAPARCCSRAGPPSRRRPGPARLLRPAGRAVTVDEQGARRPLVRSGGPADRLSCKRVASAPGGARRWRFCGDSAIESLSFCGDLGVRWLTRQARIRTR